jgi:hypothetical protein
VTETNFRELCAELVDELDKCQRPYGDQPESFLVWRTRTALTQSEPEPQGPTDAELRKLRREHQWPIVDALLFSIARAILARWGHPSV